MSVRIREYSEKDYEQVAGVWKTCFGQLRPTDSKEIISRMVKHAPGLFLVAEDGRKVVGTVFASYDGRQAGVHRLAVLPEHQRKGTGGDLVDELMKRLEKMKPIEIFLHARPDDHVMRLYKRKGFEEHHARYMKKRMYE